MSDVNILRYEIVKSSQKKTSVFKFAQEFMKRVCDRKLLHCYTESGDAVFVAGLLLCNI
jgi:hypothetical protein